jgi:hypothetical protein
MLFVYELQALFQLHYSPFKTLLPTNQPQATPQVFIPVPPKTTGLIEHSVD